MPVDRLLESDPRLPDVPYPCIAASPLGRVIESLALTNVSVLFRGEQGSGRRWLALTLHAMRFPSEPAVEFDLAWEGDHRGDETALRQEATALRDWLSLCARRPLIVHSLSRIGGAAQAALAEALDNPTPSVIAVADTDPALGRPLLDRLLTVEVPALSLRHELRPIVEAFLDSHACRSGVRSPVLHGATFDELTAAGWPEHIEQIDRFARAAVGCGDARRIMRLEIAARTIAETRRPSAARHTLRLAADAGVRL